jgi:hypothetical protein
MYKTLIAATFILLFTATGLAQWASFGFIAAEGEMARLKP